MTIQSLVDMFKSSLALRNIQVKWVLAQGYRAWSDSATGWSVQATGQSQTEALHNLGKKLTEKHREIYKVTI